MTDGCSDEDKAGFSLAESLERVLGFGRLAG